MSSSAAASVASTSAATSAASSVAGSTSSVAASSTVTSASAVSSTASSGAAFSSAASASVASSAATSASASASSTSSASSTAASSASSASSSSSTSSVSSASSLISASSSQSSASSTDTAIIGASSQTASSSSSSLSGGAIGAIVGGILGGVVLLALAWTLWRTCRDRRHRVPPPPPREVSYVPHSLSRQPVMSSTIKDMTRQSSYSTNTVLAGRPSSTIASHSRHPSYYATMPIQTPAVFNHDGSPPLPPSTSSNSPALSAEGTANTTPRKKPSLALLSTGNLHREGSTSTASGSNSNPSEMGQMRQVSSVDRLRREAERAPSPPISDPSSSRATSPFPPSSPAGSSTMPRAPFAHSLSPGMNPSYPRTNSMGSFGSSRHLGPGGRPVQVQMPKRLGARPNNEGDYFFDTVPSPNPNVGFHLNFDGGSGPHGRGYPDMGQHSRVSSMQNMSVRSGLGSTVESGSGPQEQPADPKVVLRRKGV